MSGPKLPRTVESFMAYACAMEVEAEDRYAELAEQMGTHHNREVAELFARLSRIEGKHRTQILERMGWSRCPDTHGFAWTSPEGPETTDYSELHYLMTPYHALKLAEHNERRAVEFFTQLASARVPTKVRALALEMAEDEREHVRLIEEWLAKVPPPEAGWDEDPDPPNVAD
ncbi:MAG TPA: ferritin family protein [Steroidobacteraceae bacterium]|nr:ferritin family protein [Steroidobacteraceae bacterium]